MEGRGSTMSFFDGFIGGSEAISCPHLVVYMLMVCMVGSMAYMPQVVWIQSRTIKEKIIKEFKVQSPWETLIG